MLTLFRKTDLRRTIGTAGESSVCELLDSLGWQILARNWKCKAGELDIVALDGGETVFVEVKSMRMKPGFTPALNLSPRQRKRNCNAAKVYIRARDIRQLPARFDLAEVFCRGSVVTKIIMHRDYLPPLPPYER